LVRHGDAYSAFVLVRDQPVRRVELPGSAAALDAAIDRWRHGIEDPQTDQARGPDRDASAVRRGVWESVAPLIPPGCPTIYICPDGNLARLPWTAIPGNRPGTILLEDHSLAVIPDGSYLLDQLEAQEHDHAATTEWVLTVGGVDYNSRLISPVDTSLAPPAPPADASRGDEPGAELAGARRGGSRRYWPRLPGSQREADLVAAVSTQPRSALRRRGASASTAQTLVDLPRARWAHLATHGYFDAEGLVEERRRLDQQVRLWRFDAGRATAPLGLGLRNPLAYSGLALAGANRPREIQDGGILSAEAIVELPLGAMRLAVLSACDTGLGESTEGEGVRGLVHAFHLAGCSDVVASLWHADDWATAAVMAKFYYELWERGRPPTEALRAGQLLVYRAPRLISDLAGANGLRAQREALQSETAGRSEPTAVVGTERAATRLWAAFLLSGLGQSTATAGRP
jgi:CHAT domain-containing protein